MMPTTPDPSPRASIALPLAFCFAVVAVLLRLFPHWANLSAVGAVALFAGARLSGRSAFLLPLAVMAVSDVFLMIPLARMGLPVVTGETPFIYASFLLYVALGRVVRRRASYWAVGMAFLASAQFFLITNFASWLFGIGPDSLPYAKTWGGLVACYTNAAPFYRATFLGDVIFTVGFFAVHEALAFFLARREARAQA
jgi:hypothetical protein